MGESNVAPKPLIEVWSDLMRAAQWQFNADKANGVINLKITRSDLTLSVKINIDEDTYIVTGIVTMPDKVPFARRKDMLDFMARINYQLIIGGFVMDQKDGLLVYRNSISVKGIEMSPTFVSNFINIISSTCFQNFESVGAVISGEINDLQN